MATRLSRRAIVLLALQAGWVPAVVAAAGPASPVFYERYPEDGTRVGDELELLRSGRVRVQHYPPADAADYEWARDSFTDYTWWMQMQELRFLLPAIASPVAEDQRLARAWFMRWYAVHMVPEPAATHWGEPMTVGYRAMVLVRLLKAEEQRAHPDPAVIDALRASILAHQVDLARPRRFSTNSNHGFIAALGLFETTRVVPDAAVTGLALARVDSMMARAISPAGVEKEHSPAYHFVVMSWLDEMAGYFGSLPGPPGEAAPRIAAVVARMRRAGYFLQDDAGRLPSIGDTDSLFVDAYAPGYRAPRAPDDIHTLFDPESGVAVYRGEAGEGDCRHVVFRIPGERVDMRSHCHDDALAVFFSHAGETILGDSGRYSYASSATRQFMVSARAHNTVLAHPLAAGKKLAWRSAVAISALPGKEAPAWTASAPAGPTAWTRVVRIPRSGPAIRVEDSLAPASPGTGDAADLVVLWHLGSDVTDIVPGTVREGREYTWTLSTRGGQRLRLTLESRGAGDGGIVEVGLVRGQMDPLLGWYSPAQGVVRPVTTLVARVRRDPGLSLATEVTVEESACRPGEGSRGR